MESRLVPLNGVLALLSRSSAAWPNELHRQGFRLHLIEGDVQSHPQTVRADVIAYRADLELVVLFECKSGRNISPKQARGYVQADRMGLERRGTMPGELEGRENVTVTSVFAGRHEDGDALAESLEREEIVAPLLLMGSGGPKLCGSNVAGLADFDVREEHVGEPPGLVLVDHESPIEEVRELLLQQVAVAASRGLDALDLRHAASEIHPYWPQVGKPAQERFFKLVKEAARFLSGGALRDDLYYESSNAISPRLVLTTHPATADPRGMPQVWQRLARRGASALGRKPRPEIEGQAAMAFDELATEALADDEDEDAGDD